jgi:NAD-dependent deacetylase
MKSDGPEIVVLTGAGVSAESGIATFRGTDGLWEGHRIEDVASPEGFDRKPQLVHRFYNLRRAALRTVQPNAAHSALARLEAAWPGAFLLVTQNVDDLHERAGSRRLIHMHGELRKVRCTACSASWPWEEETSTHSRCPSCGDTGTVRPDIVWFGEMPIDMDRIIARLATCAIFISIGTSGQVYPAAGFVDTAARHGARTIEVNLAGTATSKAFHERRTGPATETVPALVDELLNAHHSH